MVIDPQNDFIEGGALAVEGGTAALDRIEANIQQFIDAGVNIIVSQDWHPKGHSSFASSYEDKQPFEQIEKPYGTDTLWPDHCVQGTKGAAFYDGMPNTLNAARAIIRKGMNPDVDSYSAFMENDQLTDTGLKGLLQELGVFRVFVVGLAYDFCVGFSAVDAADNGAEVYVIKELTAAIGSNVESIEKEFEDKVEVV